MPAGNTPPPLRATDCALTDASHALARTCGLLMGAGVTQADLMCAFAQASGVLLAQMPADRLAAVRKSFMEAVDSVQHSTRLKMEAKP